MPDPSTFAALSKAGPALQFFGALSSAYGAYSSARSQRQQLKLNADLARINAGIAEKAADNEMLQGQRQEQAARLRTANLKSTQKTGMASNGVDLSSGTAQNILNTTDYMGEVDANTIAANAVKSAWGYRTQAVNARSSAAMEDANASGINTGVSAISSLLGSASSVAPQWYQLARNSQGV